MEVSATKQYRKDAYSEVSKRVMDLSNHYSIALKGDQITHEKVQGCCAWLNSNETGGFRLKMSQGPQLNLENFSLEALTELRDQLSAVIDQHWDFPYGKLINSVSRGM